MSATKLTDLTALAETPASGDLFYVVDISDTTDSPEGSSKKVTRSNMIGGLASSGANSDITSLTGLTTPLSVAQGGTAATTASAARTSLGLVIGTNVQAFNDILADLAGLTQTANTVPYFDSSTTAATSSLTSFGRSLIDDTDASTARTTLGVAIGTNVQAQNTQLQNIADLADPNADRLLFWDDSAGAIAYLTAGTGLSITTTTITTTAAGSDTQVQFNDGGTAFGGDAGLVYDKTTNVLSSVTGGIQILNGVTLHHNLPYTGDVVFNEDSTTGAFRIESDANAYMFFVDGGGNIVQIGEASGGTIADFRVAGTVFNESAADRDFRIESDTSTQAFVVDGGLNAIQIGINTAGNIMDFRAATTTFNDAGADMDFIAEGDTAGNLFRTDASADAVDIGTGTQGAIAHFATTTIVLNEIGADSDFRVEGDTATDLLKTDAGLDTVFIGTTSPGTIASFAAANIVFNEAAANLDVRMEGQTEANLFFLDASTNRIGLGNNAPNNVLDVTGTVQADGLRLDVSPTAEAIVATHTFTISLSGTNYKIPVVAA